MKKHLTQYLIITAVGMSLLFLNGCGTTKQAQLEAVAKDWCMTIRASQVIPVYPLTEDIQPGDIYLVQVPISHQQDVYKAKGFLPLDNHIARINPAGYLNFYDHSFLVTPGKTLLPRDWAHPTDTNSHPWAPAPHASFPSYSFSVRKGQGLNLAVPVDGVPVGLSLLNSDAADGSVSIKQARTIGLDTISMWFQLQKWSEDNAEFLANYAAKNGQTNYLRMVSRVYAAGEMTVNLRDARSQSAGLDVGAAKPVNLLFPELPGKTNMTETVAQNYTNGWNTLQNIISQATAAAGSNNFLPGGSLRLAGASSRTVTLKEQFEPPVVFGYVGFDCVIDETGKLGAPLPTFAALDRDSRVHQGNSKAVLDFNGQLKQQINLFHDIQTSYIGHKAPQQEKDREYAHRLGILPDAAENDWLNRIGEQVDGNNPARTRQLQNLFDTMNKAQ